MEQTHKIAKHIKIALSFIKVTLHCSLGPNQHKVLRKVRLDVIQKLHFKLSTRHVLFAWWQVIQQGTFQQIIIMIDLAFHIVTNYVFIFLIVLLVGIKALNFFKWRSSRWSTLNFIYFNSWNVARTDDWDRKAIKKDQNRYSILILILLCLQTTAWFVLKQKRLRLSLRVLLVTKDRQFHSPCTTHLHGSQVYCIQLIFYSLFFHISVSTNLQ